ncbi:MAG: hypothetical protein ACR2F6_06850 [Mycobacteriales bacterium]
MVFFSSSAKNPLAGEPGLVGLDLGGGGHLDAEVVQRAARAFQQDQCERQASGCAVAGQVFLECFAAELGDGEPFGFSDLLRLLA